MWSISSLDLQIWKREWSKKTVSNFRVKRRFHWMTWTAAIWHESITDKMQIYRVHELYITLSRFLRGDMYYTNEGILSLICRILINVRFLSYRHLANNHPPSWKHKFLVTALPCQGFYGLAAGEKSLEIPSHLHKKALAWKMAPDFW